MVCLRALPVMTPSRWSWKLPAPPGRPAFGLIVLPICISIKWLRHSAALEKRCDLGICDLAITGGPGCRDQVADPPGNVAQPAAVGGGGDPAVVEASQRGDRDPAVVGAHQRARVARQTEPRCVSAATL